MSKESRLHYVYLAGAINGLTKHEANNWRNAATTYLMKEGFCVLNPLKDEAFMLQLKEGEVYDDSKTNMAVSPNWIKDRDLDAIDYSDYILVNGSEIGKRACIGTLCEIGFALAKNKIIVLFNLDPAYYGHPFLIGIRKFKNLDTAIKGIIQDSRFL